MSRIASAACVADVDLPGAIQLLDRLLRLAVLQQRDAEVVGRETRQALGTLQARQHLDRVGRPAERQVDVRAQELDVVRDRLRHLALDPLERLQRVLGLVLLEVDARQAKRRLVAHGLVDVAFEHRADRAAGAMVHAVVELEVADVELGCADVVVQRVELRLVESVILAELGVESLQRVEVVALVRRRTAPRRSRGPCRSPPERRTGREQRSQAEAEQPRGCPRA